MQGKNSTAKAALAGMSEATKRRNPHLFKECVGSNPWVVENPQPKKRLRQSEKPLLNKLESELFAYLVAAYHWVSVRPQAKRYRLSAGMTYTPDFTAIVNGKETAWECKGPKAWEDSIVKLKAAAAIWPEVEWFLCYKRNGQWMIERVLP